MLHGASSDVQQNGVDDCLLKLKATTGSGETRWH